MLVLQHFYKKILKASFLFDYPKLKECQECHADVPLSFQLYFAGKRRIKLLNVILLRDTFPSRHCDSGDGWSHAPVRISWRGSLWRSSQSTGARWLPPSPGRMQQEARPHAAQSGDIIIMPARHCVHRKTTWLEDIVWGIVVWNMHLFCTVLYLISYVFITQWVGGQISKCII